MGSTKQEALVANRRLDYARGNTIQSPAQETVNVSPAEITFEDSVGLFGSENTFIKVNMNIISAVKAEEQEGQGEYSSAVILRRATEGDAPTYAAAFINYAIDINTINDFEPADSSDNLALSTDFIVSVTLNNLKTNNIYVDSWIDARLYGPDRRPLEGDTVYVGIHDYFYVGIHARRTKRLPYRIQLSVGQTLGSLFELTDEQRKYLIKPLT